MCKVCEVDGTGNIELRMVRGRGFTGRGGSVRQQEEKKRGMERRKKKNSDKS